MATNFQEFTKNQARGYASLVTRYAREFAPNTHLREAIKSTVEEKGDVFIIRVRARGPDARAREYGSGIHARRGPKGKITIRPRNRKYLAFYWEKANDSIPRLDDGRVLLPKVEHPGVEAANGGKGYIAPAINKARKDIRARFGSEGAKAIGLDLRAAFKTAK